MLVRLDQIERGSELIALLESLKQGGTIPSISFLEIINENYSMFIENGLSMYEMDYLIMCSYFRKENVDIAIVETGIGGRYDPAEHWRVMLRVDCKPAGMFNMTAAFFAINGIAGVAYTF